MKRDALMLAMAFAVMLVLRFWPVHAHAVPPSLVWAQLMETRIHTHFAHMTYTADIPDKVQALTGKEMTINGYEVPLKSGSEFTHFLLSRRPPSCPFCPPGEPNEIIDVETVTPVAWREDRITLEGIFALADDTHGVFFKLLNAREMP